MKILVAGATGATGRLVVGELLKRGCDVTAIVRSAGSLPVYPDTESELRVVEASLLEMNLTELNDCVAGCDAIVSCLGHNLTWKGLFGKPRRLVTDSVIKLCDAARENSASGGVKLILMNTTGNRNRDIREKHFFGERPVMGLIRLLLPPQSDNEQAAEYLRIRVGQNNNRIKWAAVRPDSLINNEDLNEYAIYPSPVRSPIFNAGKTSRINVARFMVELITDSNTWNQWKGQMPVIYNRDSLG